jgi:predicted DNA binding CopG/RHH family protein
MQKEIIQQLIVYFESNTSPILSTDFAEKPLLKYVKSFDKDVFCIESDNYSENFYGQIIADLINEASSVLFIYFQNDKKAKFYLPSFLLTIIKKNSAKISFLSNQEDITSEKVLQFLPNKALFGSKNQDLQKEFVKNWLMNP